MTDEEYGKRYTSLVRLYRSNPGAFSPDDVDQIEYLAKTLGRRFVRDPQAAEESLGNQIGDMLGQFGAGLVSGFTTIPIGEDPEDTGEAIARSLGQLMGFIGVVPGLGTATRVGTTAAAKVLTRASGIAGTQAAGRVGARLRMGAQTISKTAPGALRGKSIPMMVGNKALEYSQKYVLPSARSKALKHLSEGTVDKLMDAGETAIQLGFASAASSWSGGIDQMVKGGLLGAVEGGVFRGITNMTQLGGMLAKGGVDAKRANLAIRTISSSLYGGLQSKAFGDPIELQIYHYLLGAYFGVTDIPYTQRKAVEFINKSRNLTPEEAQAGLTERMMKPEKNPGFDELTPEVQREVTEQMDMMFGRPGNAEDIFAKAIMQTLSESDRQEIIRIKANQKVEEFMDEGLDFEEAKAKAYEFVKDKNPGDLFLEEDFYVKSDNVVDEQYNPAKGANISNLDIVRLSFDDHEIPTMLADPLTSVTEQIVRENPKVPSDIAIYMGKKISKGISEKRLFEEIIREVDESIQADYGVKANIEGNTEQINKLKKAYLKLDQFKPIRQITYNTEPGKDASYFSESNGILSDNTRSIESKGVSAIQEMANSSGRAILISKNSDNLAGGVDDLFKSFFDNFGNVSDKAVEDYIIRAAQEGRPVLFGKKDSGNIYHTDGWLDDAIDWENRFLEKLDRINEADPDLQITPLEDPILRKYQYNNMVALERLNGLSMAEMVRANKDGTGSFITRPDEINKRMQPLADGNPILQDLPSVFRDPIKAFIVKGATVKDIEGIIDADEVGSDGVTLVSNRLFNAIKSQIGATEKDGFIKFTIAGKQGDDRGMLIGKLGAFEANGSAAKLMKENNADILFFDTAVKQRGLRKETNIEFTPDGIKAVEGEAIETFNVDPVTIRVNLGVYEKAPKNIRMVKQFMSLLTDPAATQRMIDNVIKPSINGDAELNKRIKNKQISDEEIANIDIDKVSLEVINDVLFQPNSDRVYGSRLYSKIWEHVLNEVSKEDFLDPSDQKGEAGKLQDLLPELLIDNFNSSSDRIIKVVAKYNGLTPDIMNREQISAYAHEALKRYMFNRAVRPKIENSGSTFMYGNDVFLQRDMGRSVEKGTYMFAKNMRDFKIKWIDGEQISLGKAWDEYQKLKRESGESLSDLKIINTKDIVTAEGTRGAASYNRKKNVIKIDRQLLKQKYKEKAWTNPRELIELIRGEEVRSSAEKLPEDAFKSYEEWERFVINHEYEHSLYSRKDFNKEFPNGNKGDYETEINKRALARIKKQKNSLLESMERAMEFFVVRVPQDSPSGARVLKFGGFTTRNGYGMHLNAYDMKYLGGADNDGDKVHFYQNLDGDLPGSPIRDAVLANKDQWTDAEGNVRDAKEGEDIQAFEAQQLALRGRKTLKDSLDPREILKTHIYTTDGNRLVGPTANAGATSTGFFAGFKKGIAGFNTITLGEVIPVERTRSNISEIRINRISDDLVSFNELRREMMNVAVDATDMLPYNIRSATRLLSQKIFTNQDVTLLDEDGNQIDFNKLNRREFNAVNRNLSFTRVDGVRRLVRINETINGRRFNYETNKSERIDFAQAMSELSGFSDRYNGIDLGNAYWRAVTELSRPIEQKWRNVIQEITTKQTDNDGNITEFRERASINTLAKYARFNVNKIFDIVNAYMKADIDSEAGNVLASSGQKRLHILKEGVDPYRDFSTVRHVEEAVSKLSSLLNNDVAYKAALKAGVSKQKLKGIRKHVDSVKYMRTKFVTTDKTRPSYMRNVAIKESALGLKNVKNVDELLETTAKYKKSLKTKEERDYYDFYMIGSLSEQRFNIDDIARMEYIVQSKAAETYAEAEQMINDDAYDSYTYEYLKSEEFRERNPGFKDMYKTVDRLYQNDVASDFGFSVPAVDDANIAKWFADYTDIIQAKPDQVVKRDILDPTTSRFLEKVLLNNISQEKATEIKNKLASDLKESGYRQPGREGEVPSLNEMLNKYNTVRPPINAEEARRSSVSDEIITERFTDSLFDKMISDAERVTDKGQIEFTFGKIDDTIFNEGTEQGRRNQQLLKELKAHLSKLPSNVIKNIERIYEGYVGKEVGASTVRDIENFITFLNSFHKKTFLERLVGADPGTKISRLYWAFFPDTIARRLTSFDPNVSTSKTIQVLTKDGYKSKEVADIMSHYEQMRLFLSAAEENRSSLVNMVTSRINDELSYLNDESVLRDRDDLIEAAIAIKEYNNVARELNILRNPEVTQEQRLNAENNYEQYKKNFDNVKDTYEKLKNKKYIIYIDGVKQEVTGKDLMGDSDTSYIAAGLKMKDGMISKSFTKLNKFFFDTIINPIEAEQFVVRRPDGSLDAFATMEKMDAQFQGTKFESERIANIGLSNLFELSKEIDYYYNTEVKVGGRKMYINQIQDPQLREKKLSDVRLADRGRVIYDGPQGKEYARNSDGTFILNPMIGKIDAVDYFPHTNHSEAAIIEWQKKFILNKDLNDVTNNEALAFKKWTSQGKVEDAGIARDFIDDLFTKKRWAPKLHDRNVSVKKFGNLSGRSDRIIGGWELSAKAYDQYAQSLNSAYHKLYGTIMAQKYNRQFRESGVMGDITESWAKFGDIYIQDFVGKPTSFGLEYFVDPYLNFKKSPYYALSDDAAMGYYNRIAKFFGWKEYTNDEMGKMDFQAKMKAFTRLEGKTQLMTLLTNTTSMINNYVGGTAQTAISSGLRPWRLAGNWQYLRDNIDPSITSAEKAREMAIEFGAIESYISSEVGPTAQLRSTFKRFKRDLGALYRSGDFTKQEVVELAKKHGMSDVISGPGAWMMSSVEVRLRTRSFWAHYLQAREVMMADGSSFRWDDPMLIQQALKGVWGSQFLYNAPNRPAIARSNLGRIFSRFQLWSWNSVRFRRDIYQKARESGFQEGTPEYQRYVRMAQADAFMFALAALMPMSMFESILPAPWNYLQDFSDYFFGDEDERDRAFFGQIPYPFNPLQVALPPSARYITTGVSVPIEMAIAMLSDKDLSDALDYRVVSLMPYGMLARNIVRSIDTPAMAPQYLTGIHFHTLTRLMNQMEDSATLKANGLYEAKSRYVDEELQRLIDHIKLPDF